MRLAFQVAGHSLAGCGFHAARKHSGTRLYRPTRVGLFVGPSSVDTMRCDVALEQNDVQCEVEDF